MNFKIILISIIFFLIVGSVFAVTISEPSLPNNPAQSQDYGELFARISNIESKVSALPTTESVSSLLQGHLDLTNSIMENFRSAIVVLMIIINILFLGVGFGIYFNLKSKGRV